MKPSPLFLASILLAASAIATPAALAEARARAGEAPSCGEWVAHREKSSPLALGDTHWLLGYLTGAADANGKDYLSGMDNASIFRWMDSYCRTNPLRDVGSGAKSLAAELAGRKAMPK